MQPPALSQEMSHLPVHRADGRRGAGPFPELGQKKPESFLELMSVQGFLGVFPMSCPVIFYGVWRFEVKHPWFFVIVWWFWWFSSLVRDLLRIFGDVLHDFPGLFKDLCGCLRSSDDLWGMFGFLGETFVADWLFGWFLGCWRPQSSVMADVLRKFR